MNRTTLRRTLLVAGLLPALLVVGFATKVVLMVGNASDGRDRFAEAAYADAAEEFAANGSLNFLEPWVAPFDEGAAVHADGRYSDAIALYDEALQDVPASEECTVRINQALAHEALGDAAAEAGENPIPHWRDGIDTLAEGDCPTDSGRGEDQTDDAAAVDQRLRDKIRRQQQSQQQQQEDPKSQQQRERERQRQQQEQRRERRLDRRNDDAIEEKKDYDDSNTDRDYSQYEW